MRRLILILALASAVLAAPTSVPAAGNAELATRWGLIGRWKITCNAPAKTSDNWDVYSVRDGKLYLDRDLGGGEKDSKPVVFVSPGENDTLYLIIEFPRFKQVRENVIVKSPDGNRRRTISNRNVDTDVYSVRDAKFTDDGRELSWFNRCS